MYNRIIIPDDVRVAMKQDIVRYYFTGKMNLQDIGKHYGYKKHTMNIIISELVDELRTKTSNIY